MNLQLINDIARLSPEKQREVADFVAFLIARHQAVNVPQPEITTGDKTIGPSDLFGSWKDKPRHLDAIRHAAWQCAGD